MNLFGSQIGRYCFIISNVLTPPLADKLGSFSGVGGWFWGDNVRTFASKTSLTYYTNHLKLLICFQSFQYQAGAAIFIIIQFTPSPISMSENM